VADIVHDQDIIFHLAAAMGSQAGDPVLSEMVNVTNTELLVRAAAAAEVGRFIQVSSMSAYGPPNRPVIDEEQPLAVDQSANYGRTKALGEQRALAVAGELGLELAVVRPGMVFGPRSKTWTVEMVRLLQRRVPVIIGGGRGHAQPIYIDNLVDLLILAASRPEAAGQSFNGVDWPLPWRAFFGYYGRMCGRRPWGIPLWLARFALEIFRRLTGRSESAATLLSFYTAQAVYPREKAERLLGYRPQVSLEEGMARTEAWLRQSGHLPARS
jgi:2-alkyl-3-oxoalkanoate reductase